MKACGHCKERVEWRFKDGWGVLACADWFSATCEGAPLAVELPSQEELPNEHGLTKMSNRAIWSRGGYEKSGR